ncbi:MAG: amidohydrolase family protein [Caulobacteraceae bacterium]|nr:amidohydrolase family protein [Caulobacteraceae bacterium]
MSGFDLVIRGGEIHDGLGSDPTVGDVGIRDGVIAALGQFNGAGGEEIDARNAIVTPGFVDVHTHYDGQATWETRMSPSSNHGVTTVVMGNCGVGFAPCRPDQRDLLVNLMEGVEDVPEIVMTRGLPWNWETFPDYLDALERRELDIDVAAQVPHSALRVYVMGERGAAREPPTSRDLQEMRRLTAEAVRAGAIGVSTSRNMLHRSRSGALAPSLYSEKDELEALALGLRDANAGVFQVIPEVFGDAKAEFQLMKALAQTSGRPLSFSLVQPNTGDPSGWSTSLALLAEANREGLAMKAQVFPRPVGYLYGLDLSFHPFSLHPSFRPLLDLPLAEKVRALRDPSMRERLLSEKAEDPNPIFMATVDSFRFAVPLGDPPNYEPDLEDQMWRQAAREGLSVAEYAYDLLLEREGRTIFFMPAANYRDGNLAVARTMVRDPNTVLGLGDGGAHYGMICDASFPTFVLQTWMRDQSPGSDDSLASTVRALTSEPADLVGLGDRGRLTLGSKADINVIDLARLGLHAPKVVRDLPAGGRRLQQKADGYRATIVSGAVTYRDGVHSGALPGRLVRGARGR